MRRLEFATLLLSAVSLAALGCRQTTGPSTAGPTGPLSPVSAGQAPSLNPFGGATRVTPPSTGSFSSPNAYIGGPPGQAGLAPTAPGGLATAPNPGFATASGQAPIGSGVQAAGWTETGSGVATAGPTAQQGFGSNSFAPNAPSNANGVAPAAFGSPAPTTPTSPQLGGMQVIDLTGAPPPPGYHPSQAPPGYQPSQVPPGYQPAQTQGYQPAAPSGFQAPTSTPPPTIPSSPSGSQPATSFQTTPPATGFQQQPATTYPNQSGFQSVPEAEIAARMTPIPTTTHSVIPPVPNGSTTGPSTDPIGSSTLQSPSSDLPWRRPGTTY